MTDCGCRINPEQLKPPWGGIANFSPKRIEFCPLHRAAPELLEACKMADAELVGLHSTVEQEFGECGYRGPMNPEGLNCDACAKVLPAVRSAVDEAEP